MSYYQDKIKQLKENHYSNDKQIASIISVKNYIDTHYENDINLDILSHNQFISKFHLLRLFKRYYGLTPKQYLIDKRIETSKTLLKKGTSVTETCFAIGFQSLGSFSTLFKSRTGKSPSQYQKEQLSRSN
ncbi:helix-turn-helix domain-containing protein [Winogradskyella sp. PE311]|uniref:helix-turn-helix domain-containing protein n=1 Tax=Winogradskyella sp. PE311 TaxID=3366943 RepID=UPI00397EBA78